MSLPYTRGVDLASERTLLGLLQKEVADRMGVPPARISVIENQVRVTERTAARYREALATFQTVATGTDAA